MAMTARMRRLLSDYAQLKKDFAGHKNIIVTPVGGEPPEKYHVTYFVNGIYLLPDGRIETLGRHEVEITLHSEYPRYKPICKIMTPIWHPNFRDGQICIGDIWGAGESLTDIIINIGDMIQYKSWNSFSPLSADAAQWAIENKHLFPVGNINLNIPDYASAKDKVDIDVIGEENKTEALFSSQPFDEEKTVSTGFHAFSSGQMPATDLNSSAAVAPPPEPVPEPVPQNDFEITAEELAGIEFVPTAQRMQGVSGNSAGGKKKVNFKTVLVKGILWALIGALVGFGVSELLGKVVTNVSVAQLIGKPHLSRYLDYSEKSETEVNYVYEEFKAYCAGKGLDPDKEGNLDNWLRNGLYSEKAKGHLDKYSEYRDKSEEELYKSYQYEFRSDEDALGEGIKRVNRLETAFWSMIVALFCGLFLGLGEGIFYGSAGKAVKYAAIGAGISLAIGFVSGYLAQLMYASVSLDNLPMVVQALVRAVGWSIMGVGIGLAIGLIKPTGKRILFCSLGGLIGAFIGGFAFDFVGLLIPNDIASRAVGIVLMGLLIGLGVGLLEQFAKQAWLKVIRGEFEGKEYLVFTGTTSIGNNGKNTIVLFKDKLVGPHHCDIVLEGSKYTLIDRGTPMGTVVNGRKISKHILRQGDTIAIGNSVLVFNTK